MKLTSDNKILIRENYFIDLNKEVKVPTYRLSEKESKRFSSMSTETKVKNLKFLKSKKEEKLKLEHAISQSKYLKLYEGVYSMHLRIDNSIYSNESIEDINLEKDLAIELQSVFNSITAEDINFGMSSDMNKKLVSKGFKIA